MKPSPSAVVRIRPGEEIVARQGLRYFIGISARNSGARNLSLNLVTLPPGAAATPHLHRGFETAIYVLRGQVDTRFGPGLSESVIADAGDFLFIPADVPHQPVNLSVTDPALAIVARNVADEQESVVLYDPLQDAPGSVAMRP